MNFYAAGAYQSTSGDADGAAALAELALNLHWTWNHATDALWQRLDAELWEATQNPWAVLQTISKDTMDAALEEPEFRARLDGALQQLRDRSLTSTWFQRSQLPVRLSAVAYFSMEFMLRRRCRSTPAALARWQETR